MSVLRRYPKQPMLLRKSQGGIKGYKCNAFGEKDVVVQRFLGQFFEGECLNIPGCQKQASKALHSRILNPKFVHLKGILLRTQICVKKPLHCNGFFAAICVSRHKVDAHYFSKTLQTQTNILPNLAFGFYIGTV